MTFFPEINFSQTVSNAKRKLKEYPRWKRIANDFGVQKVTATYSFEPRQLFGKPSKPVEYLAINRVTAIDELEAIEHAVSSILNLEYRKILIDKYLLTYPKEDYVIYRELGYEKTQYYDMLGKALVAFAEIYRSGQIIVETEK